MSETEAPPVGTVKFWSLLSGGKDSVATAHVLAAQGRLEGCLFIDTGISAPDVQPFVHDFCAKRGWPLDVARTPVSFEAIVRKYGFPGPAAHSAVMHQLKGRAIRAWRKMHPGTVFASGVRSGESRRRFGNAREWSKIQDARAWCYAPILDWKTEEVWDYIRANDLEISPAWWNLHISGDCLCGAFARPDEVYLLETFYPVVAARIRALETEISGHPHCRWGRGEGFGQQSRLDEVLCQGCAVP